MKKGVRLNALLLLLLLLICPATGVEQPVEEGAVLVLFSVLVLFAVFPILAVLIVRIGILGGPKR